jgi:hypothetical protein
MPAKSGVPEKFLKADSPWGRWLQLAVLACVLAGTGLFLYSVFWVNAPHLKLLFSEHGARWVRRERQFSVTAWGGTEEVVLFQKRVKLPAQGRSHVLTVRALRSCEVFWDRRPIYSVPPEEQDWTQPREIALPLSPPGEHSIAISVKNALGPAALLAYCDSLDVHTGPDWQEWDGKAWQPVTTLDDVKLPETSLRFASPIRALVISLWWLVPLFFAVCVGYLWQSRRADLGKAPIRWTASGCRWIVLAAWLLLAANNFTKLPPELGYDWQGHVDYIRFIVDHGALPDARDGWQMFQAPLFYAIAAVLYRLLTSIVSGSTALVWLRWLPLICGMTQVEICFRAGRCLFPEREDLQSLAVLLGGLLPMNVYMSQTLSNEPLCGALSALILLWSWQALREPDAAERTRWQWWMGLVLGLDLLTKATAVLLAPLVAIILGVMYRRRGGLAGLKAFARCFGTAAIVSGWYYGRSWLRYGQLFVGGWDPARGLLWWQDPGYRTPSQMASFGRALLQPIYAGFYSIWDGFFATLWLDGNLGGIEYRDTRPPWNMSLLLAAPWPALLMSVAIALGFLRGLRCRDASLRHSLQLADGTLMLYVAAFALLALEVPAFSQAKASYTLGLTPIYAVLCVAGFDLLPSSRPLRAAATAFVACWCTLVYGAYFAM